VVTSFFALLIIFTCERIYSRLTDDFQMRHLIYPLADYSAWEPQISPEAYAQTENILNQPFSYLGKGEQTYVFVSADQRYVLKCFKFKHIKPSLFLEGISKTSLFKTYKERAWARLRRKLDALFSGYQLAYERMREESGLLFLQMHPTHMSKEITVKDKLGLQRTLDLGEVVFVVQKKGETLHALLNRLLEAGDMEAAKIYLQKIFAMYRQEYAKGLYDRDHNLLHNVGFAEEMPFHLDMGGLAYDQRITQADIADQHLARAKMFIAQWLRAYHPQSAPELIAFMQSKVCEFTQLDTRLRRLD
jgi:hypothetical protein